jgi:hypothetical protein
MIDFHTDPLIENVWEKWILTFASCRIAGGAGPLLLPPGEAAGRCRLWHPCGVTLCTYGVSRREVCVCVSARVYRPLHGYAAAVAAIYMTCLTAGRVWCSAMASDGRTSQIPGSP